MSGVTIQACLLFQSLSYQNFRNIWDYSPPSIYSISLFTRYPRNLHGDAIVNIRNIAGKHGYQVQKGTFNPLSDNLTK